MSLLVATAPAAAQYKVVGPDGKVSYTDRPPAGTKAQPISSGSAGAGVSTSNLPYELKQVVSRFPVTIYTSNDCNPCDNGRALLKQRGVPYSERTVTTSDDLAALKKSEGVDNLPVLRIGGQQLRGFSSEEWNSYLTTAGYPTQSKLPANYAAATPAPLAPKPATATDQGGQAPSNTTSPVPSAGAASGIRF
jgi:glutaredoxin